jgi:hypothetical protein
METYNIYIFQQINEHNSRTEQVVKSEIELNLPLMVSEHVYKFLRICLRGTYVIEQKPHIFVLTNQGTLTLLKIDRGGRCHDRMVVGFTITCAISAYHH